MAADFIYIPRTVRESLSKQDWALVDRYYMLMAEAAKVRNEVERIIQRDK